MPAAAASVIAARYVFGEIVNASWVPGITGTPPPTVTVTVLDVPIATNTGWPDRLLTSAIVGVPVVGITTLDDVVVTDISTDAVGPNEAIAMSGVPERGCQGLKRGTGIDRQRVTRIGGQRVDFRPALRIDQQRVRAIVADVYRFAVGDFGEDRATSGCDRGKFIRCGIPSRGQIVGSALRRASGSQRGIGGWRTFGQTPADVRVNQAAAAGAADNADRAINAEAADDATSRGIKRLPGC
jgi:hypothetical protein